MSDVVAKLGITRQPGHLYYVKKNAVYKRKAGAKAGAKATRVAAFKGEMDSRYLYFLDKQGNVSRAMRKSAKTKLTTKQKTKVGKFIAEEMKSLKRGAKRVKSRAQAIAIGISRAKQTKR